MKTEHVTLFYRDGVVGLLKLHSNWVGNFKESEFPNILLLEHTDEQTAKKIYSAAVQDSKEKWWKVIFSGEPQYG